MAKVVGRDIYIDPKVRYTSVNPTGYRYSVRHPLIAQLWETYRKKHGIHPRHPASDMQRNEFERHIDELIEAKRIIIRGG